MLRARQGGIRCRGCFKLDATIPIPKEAKITIS